MSSGQSLHGTEQERHEGGGGGAVPILVLEVQQRAVRFWQRHNVRGGYIEMSAKLWNRLLESQANVFQFLPDFDPAFIFFIYWSLDIFRFNIFASDFEQIISAKTGTRFCMVK
jgi:hypothetical protein